MARFRIGVLALLLALLAVPACASPATPPPPPTAPSAAPKPQEAPASPQDEAWARVVEAAKKEGRVNVYSFGFIGDLGPAMTEAFYRRYGIRAEMVTGPGAGLSERVRTEIRMKGVVADVGEFSAAFSVLLLQEGNLVALAQELPVLREDVWVASPLLDQAGHILRHNLSYGSPWVNTDQVRPEQEPRAWTDLLDPRWKGKILSIDPRTTTTPDRWVHMLTKYKLVEPGFFPRLAAQGLSFPSGVGPRPPYVALARGEGAILVYGLDAQGAVVIAEGAHVKPTAPREGLTATGSAIQLIKGAPHPNAGKLFINFVLSQEGHEMETRMRLVGSLRKDVPDRSVYGSLKPFKVFASSIEDEAEINKGFRDTVAAKALGVR